MQNWDNMQTAAANYEQHNNNNNWYNSVFASADIKSEPVDMESGSRALEKQTKLSSTSNTGSTTTAVDVMSHLENYLRQQQQQQQPQTPHQQMNAVDTLTAMTPSPSNTDSLQNLYDSSMQQQLMQQQQYQQQFQQAQQQAAAQVTSSTSQTSAASLLPLGFNPLTPPGLPTAIIPSITHFYHHHQQQHQQQQQQQHQKQHQQNAQRIGQQTPSPQPTTTTLPHQTHMMMPTTPMDSSEKLQSALTPRNTPPMDITPPKSPKHQNIISNTESLMHMMQQQEKDALDAQSDFSDDIKYAAAAAAAAAGVGEYEEEEEEEEDKMIREPIYNSHGKIKNYKCKSCGLIAITKVLFWEHARTHMKPEKLLQCPKCPFVTELKHHLEYHIRKHKNLKPFQCDKCSYTCVNKSMLNSHRKSHSSVYQYRCSDCDYATKYCHSFKLHLRKYDHKPGLVLDEEGLPNPSVVIDVYGTRRGPKSKSSTGSSSSSSSAATAATNKRNNRGTSHERLHTTKALPENASEFKLSASQLSAALQSFTLPTHQQQQQQQHQMPVSPAKSPSSKSSDLTTHSLNTLPTQNNTQQQQQKSQQQQTHHLKNNQRQPLLKQHLTNGIERNNHASAERTRDAMSDATTKASMSNLLPPLATILQQNPNMAFFPYWNLNLQMLAAQQQAAALAQMPARMREKALQELQNLHTQKDTYDITHDEDDDEEENVNNEYTNHNTDADCNDQSDSDDDHEHDRKSTDSAMDLSQGSPIKVDIEKRRTPANCGALKFHEESNDTPIISTNGAARRKGRVLKLDAILQVRKSASTESLLQDQETKVLQAINSDERMSTISSPNPHNISSTEEENKSVHSDVADMDVMESTEVLVKNNHLTKATNTKNNLNQSSGTHNSSSGNSSNTSVSSSTISSVPTNATTNGPSSTLGTMYECKYCDIYFKDAVLYTIHMGYHSCDDVFKCNMCGEKCDGPVGLFVHMARNAHS